MLPLLTSRNSLISVPETFSRFIVGNYVVQPDEVTTRFSNSLNLRIIPTSMVFQGAFEGKKYTDTLTIQNCGKESVVVRICPPNSYAFKINPIVRGLRLSPGLSIVRHISFTYMRATVVPYAWIPIYVNDQRLDYKLLVSLSEVMISPIPRQIDFGTINAGHSAAVRMLSLRNDGSKGTRFAIDLGTNEIELIVEPSKGIIQPLETVTLHVECLGTTEGAFSREFWVKCETPLRIGVKGTIVTPQLQSFHPNTTQDFTLVDFSRTYFGTHCVRTLVVKNLNATAAVYCTLAEVGDENVNLEDAHKFNSDYLNFHITPGEGSMLADEGRIFQFTYTPIKAVTTSKDSRRETPAFCCIRIVRVPCLDIGQILIPVKPTIQDQDAFCRYAGADETISVQSGLLTIEDEESFRQDKVDNPVQETLSPSKEAVRVLLYGEAEPASISIRPDRLNLLKITINEPVTRELQLLNNSFSLPIIFSYKKVCFVSVEPTTGVLPPSGKIEVGVTITPAKIGQVQTKVAFDLLYFNRPREDNDYVVVGKAEIPLIFDVPSAPTKTKPKFNMGITPMYVKEVGVFTDDVRFNSPVKMPRATLVEEIRKRLPKDDDALIAFPNDRPKSLRPWKTPTECRTICAGIPRAVSSMPGTYELSSSKQDLKRAELSYYVKYIRHEAEHLKQVRYVFDAKVADYDISKKNNLLLRDLPNAKWLQCSSFKEAESKKPLTFIPLTASQLKQVEVFPSYIKLGKMAPNTTITKPISVNNKNNVSIRVFMKARKNVIGFPDGERSIVKPHNQIDMKISYKSHGLVGRYSAITDFIINDTHSFAVLVTVDVVPKCVTFLHKCITFESDGRPYQYLDLYNPVNVPISFHWQVPESCFGFEPISATIPAHRYITCVAIYNPHHVVSSATEVTLCSENGRHQNVSVLANLNPPKVAFKSPKIEFKDIPLNLPQQGRAALRNLGNEPVTFIILNPEPMHGISISPVEGVFQGCSEQTFTINVRISACVSFSCAVQIELQKVKTVKLQISGNVIYPEIVLKPDSICLSKIVPSCFDKQVFVIMNKSPTIAKVQFRFEDYTEYSILETTDVDVYSNPVKEIQLKAHEERELYLHFNPIGAALYNFYLPIIINDLLGPVILGKPDTQNPSFYTQTNQKNYVELYKAKVIKIPSKLPIVEIRSSVGGDMLRFSKMHFNFKYFPYSGFNAETHAELKIWNGSKDTRKFCIRTDELEDPFFLTYLTGNSIDILESAIVCVLAPQEEVVLKVEFLPRHPGIFHIRLPIYVRHYLEGELFNYLFISGCFPNPTIYALENTVCLEPIPLKCETEYSLFIKTAYHKPTCQISAESSICQLRIHFIGESFFDEAKQAKEVRVSVKCWLEEPTSFDAIVRFFCTCGADCNINIKGCADNCTITTHAFVRSYTAKLSNQAFEAPIRRVSFGLSSAQVLPTLRKSHESCGQYTDASTLYSGLNNDLQNYYKNFNESSFPLFPEEDDHSAHAKYMRYSIAWLEEWLFHQIFYRNKYCTIPEGIAAAPESVKKPENSKNDKKKQQQKPFPLLQFVEVLRSLVGPRINQYIPIREIPHDTVHRINYMYNVYASTRDFIIARGGFLPHVLPENLLPYSDYVIFIKTIHPLNFQDWNEDVTILAEEIFFRLSKQNWMDVLLQTYKVLVLNRVRIPSEMKEVGRNPSKTSCDVKASQSNTSSNVTDSLWSFLVTPTTHIKKLSMQTDAFKTQDLALDLGKTAVNLSSENTTFWRHLCRAEPRNLNIFNEPETILLHWLEYHFNNQKEVLWGPTGLHCSEEVPEARNIRFFEFDLNDGLVLIAITTYYCPYLIPHLKDIYLIPVTEEQALHNISKLLQSWDMIGLSFTVTPKQIIKSSGLQMLMLTNYLYEVLPGFYPYNTIRFKTGLSTKCLEEVTIANLSDFSITYNVIFFRNENKLFSVPQTVINMLPRQKKNIVVEYNAKMISLEDVTMVLNGETPKRTYAKSMAFTLIGEPIPSYSTTTATISAPLYQIFEVLLKIQAPYTGAHFYDIYYSVSEPDDINTCKIIPWSEEKFRKVPKRILSATERLNFDADGVGNFDITICCVTTKKRSYWIIFKNPSVGAFTVKLITVPDLEIKMYCTVPVLLPEEFKMFRCCCKGGDSLITKKRCPRTILIKIPCRNDFLWNAVADSMMKIVDETDLPFWKEYLGTSVGIRINKWMVEDVVHNHPYDIQEIFDSTVTYLITLERFPSSASMPPITTIQNVHCLDYHQIPVHVTDDGGQPNNFQFCLESENGVELRYYSVVFSTKSEEET